MSIEFTIAASKEAFISRLDAINDSLKKGEYLDETLTSYTKYTACFWMRFIVSPILLLFKSDAFAPFRANTVATSLFRYCNANKDFLSEDLIKTKVVTIFDHLNRKEKATVTAQKDAVQNLVKPAQPEPQAAGQPVPQPVVSPAPTTVSAPVENKDKPQEPPAVVPAAASAEKTAIVANQNLPPAAPPVVANPQPTPVAAVQVQAKVSQAEIDFAKRQLSATSALLAFEMHRFIGKTKGISSFCFSPVGLMDSVAVIANGTSSDERSRLLKRLSLAQVKMDLIESQLKDYRSDLEKADITLRSSFVAGKGLKDKEFAARLKTMGIFVSEPVLKHTEGARSYLKEEKSARRILNEEMQTATGIENLVVLDDSYTKQKHLVTLDVLSLFPTVALAPREKIPQRLFNFSGGNAQKTDFYGFYDVKVLEKETFKMVLLPYTTEAGQPPLEKVIILPNKDTDLSSLSKKLNAEFIRKCQEELKKDGVEKTTVYLPKAEISYQQDDLLDHYNQMKVELSTVAGEKLGSVRQRIEFVETMPEVVPPAANEAAAKNPLFIDRTFYYFVKRGDDVLLQGRVDDRSALETQEA